MAKIEDVNRAEIQELNLHLLKLMQRMDSVEFELNKIITYSEYLADHTDLIISYTEFLATVISKNDSGGIVLGNRAFSFKERIPKFAEYKKREQDKVLAEIPF